MEQAARVAGESDVALSQMARVEDLGMFIGESPGALRQSDSTSVRKMTLFHSRFGIGI